MGMNFYAVLDPCPHCHRGDIKLHIGKLSTGWPFIFQKISESHGPSTEWIRLFSFESWCEFLQRENVICVDSSDNIYGYNDFRDIVLASKESGLYSVSTVNRHQDMGLFVHNTAMNNYSSRGVDDWYDSDGWLFISDDFS